jgi:mediator of RNA polymerase II transcription subunit 14
MGAVTLVHDSKFTSFSECSPSQVVSSLDGQALRVHLCADEVVFITIDSRTGRLNLRDTGDLAAAGRAPRFAVMTTAVNDNPTIITQALIRLRLEVNIRKELAAQP